MIQNESDNYDNQNKTKQNILNDNMVKQELPSL